MTSLQEQIDQLREEVAELRQQNEVPKKKKVKKEPTEAQKNSKWAKHVAEFRKNNPDVNHKQVFAEAKKTYNKD